MKIGKAEFARNPLKIITQVKESAEEVTVTHRGVPSVTIRKLTEEEKEAHCESRERNEKSDSEIISKDYPEPFKFCIHRAYGELLNTCVYILSAFAENMDNLTDHNDVEHDPYRDLLYGVLQDLNDFGKPDTREVYTKQKHQKYVDFINHQLSTINSEYNNLSALIANYTPEEESIIKQYINQSQS